MHFTLAPLAQAPAEVGVGGHAIEQRSQRGRLRISNEAGLLVADKFQHAARVVRGDDRLLRSQRSSVTKP